MIKKKAKRRVGLIWAVIMTVGVVLPSCSKKKPTEIVTPPIPPPPPSDTISQVSVPILETPLNGATKVAPNPIFRWRLSMGKNSDYFFTLQISKDSAFGSSVLLSESLATRYGGDFFSADLGLSKSTTYYWRVKGINRATGDSSWSRVSSFTTGPVELIATLKTPGRARAVAVQGSYSYLVTDSGLYVIDVTNPASPTLVGSYNYNFGYYLKIKLAGSYAYLATDTSLLIFDISSPTSPNFAGRYGSFSPFYPPLRLADLAVAGNYAYLSINYDNYFPSGRAMEIIDVSNPATPVFSGAWYLPYNEGVASQIGGVAVAGNYVYLSSFHWENNYSWFGESLDVIDVSNPNAPTSAGSLHSGFSKNLTIAGNYLYSSGGPIFNITDPAAPTFVAISGFSGRVSIGGNFAYWARGAGYYYVREVLITDLSNPLAPALVGRYNAFAPSLVQEEFATGSGEAGIDGLLLVTDEFYGLRILRIGP